MWLPLAATYRLGACISSFLGSGAGGGLPQWNCNCPVCRLAWDSDPRVAARTQSSIAVSVDRQNWSLINCSPDLRQQIISNPQLHPRNPAQYGRRDTPIEAVVLTNADVDHIAGLLTLREKQGFKLFATATILEVLARNQIFNVLDPDHVDPHDVRLKQHHRNRTGPDRRDLRRSGQGRFVP